MYVRKIILLIAFTLTAATSAAASVKVALLDSLQSEKIASERYVTDYTQGVELGTKAASSKGVSLDIREFFFGKNRADILGKVREIQEWKPDIVIGPRSSDLFLMLKTLFPDTLVISPLATAAAVAQMPDNFYSITPPNDSTVAVLADFAKATFPGKGLFQLIQIDCINCKDFASQFVEGAKAIGIPVRNTEPATYLSSATETFDLDSQMQSYQKGDIILLPNNSYSSGVLMGRLAEKLKTNDLIFLGSDGWGDWAVGYAGKFKSPYSYSGFRTVPWSIKKQDPSTLDFARRYRAQYSAEPTSNISLIMFSMLSSVTDVVLGAKAQSTDISRATILAAFRNIHKHSPDFGRPDTYAILKVSQSGEEYIGLHKIAKPSMKATLSPKTWKKGS